MASFYSASLAEFLSASESELTGILSASYAGAGFTTQFTAQTRTWIADVEHLKQSLQTLILENGAAPQWTILLEFSIPRKEKRIDVVLIAGNTILILELKSSGQGIESVRQAEEYALLLHYFHRPSNQRKIRAFVVSPNTVSARATPQMFLPLLEAPAFWIAPVEQVTWKELGSKLIAATRDQTMEPIDPVQWANGEYRPVPTIIQAAKSLRSGLNVREIAHSRAAQHDVERLTQFVHNLIQTARSQNSFSICFITGVPGSGKTLVGLNLAFTTSTDRDPIHFMSGTGPLVQVLQAVLARDQMEREGEKAQQAKMNAKALIENVHVFAKHYSDEDKDRAPFNHVIIFDEAQRAWDKAQNLSKFKRPYSEPEMLLSIMERHQDWAVVIALVGGGQEINNGEAGIEEWGRALSEASKPWKIFVSPEALNGGSSVAGSKLFSERNLSTLDISAESQLHLNVPVRSLRSDSYASWVNFVLNGDSTAAAALREQDSFPIFLTRSLDEARSLLRQNTLGESRCGLVASSAAARLRAEGLEPDSSFHADYPWDHWFLAERTDVRSSYKLEVFATEFEIQGLELDWIGLCWGGDFVWSRNRVGWLTRAFRQGKSSKWSEKMSDSRQIYRRNAYRVLLTRARQGIVLYVPSGDAGDPTRVPTDFDETAQFLVDCGARIAATIKKQVDSI